MKLYEKPSMNVVCFEEEDVLTMSTPVDEFNTVEPNQGFNPFTP